MARLKPVEWVGSSRSDIRSFPDEVREVMGEALYRAQQGNEHPAARALKGFGGRRVIEIVGHYRGDTYRAIYTVRFENAIYVLHAFQKKSKKGIETPKRDIDLIKKRYAEAQELARECEKTKSD